MPTRPALHQLFESAARAHGSQTALIEPGGGRITYAELDALANRVTARLVRMGVQPGDRVGVYLPKSIDSVAAILGVLKTGAAYVPVDPTGPPARNAYIHSDCSVRAVIIESSLIDPYRNEFQQNGAVMNPLVVEAAGGGAPLRATLDRLEKIGPAAAIQSAARAPGDLAYILYTSGSTGKPKGVMLTHDNGVSYVDWCSETFCPTEEDCFSSHAPFHFDLSILDIYVPLKHGAALVLIGEDLGKDPVRLAQVIAAERITCWYSTPSILSLLAQYGKLENYDYSALRIVNFAGEPFPIKHLRTLHALWPHPRYFNLYGPTETNVCTFYEVPGQIPESQTKPFPIGVTCWHVRTMVLNENNQPVPDGDEGELLVSGRGVTPGYWKMPEQNARVFYQDAGGVLWYRTGDVVVKMPDGNYDFLGRRDRMVKKRGYRIELGEIESALYRHPSIKEAAVVSLPDREGGVCIKAWLACHAGQRPSIVQLKGYCAAHLPAYMVPDVFGFQDALPKTSTDKVDYQRLKGAG